MVPTVGGLGLSSLDGVQKEVLCLPEQGHTVVLGTAGSGKSILAVHRALYLADPDTEHCGHTLLITFNRCLATYLRHLAGRIPRNITVENYHKFARGYLGSRQRMGCGVIADTDLVAALCAKAVEATKTESPTSSLWHRSNQFFLDEIKWIAQHGVGSSKEYEQAQRVGRADAGIARKNRRAVFKVYKRYRKLRTAHGKDFDWDDLSHAVLHEFTRDRDARRYRHIVVDEGQDLSPMELRSLAAAVPEEGSLTFFGDMAQQIYGTQLSWRSAGLRIRGRGIWQFRQNYRNTKQIADLALAIADSPSFGRDPDIVPPVKPTADGPLPTLKAFPDEVQECRYVAGLARTLAKTGTVAVLFRDRALEGRLTRLLSGDAKRLHRDLKTWPHQPGLFYGTYHSAKGLEFDTVILPHLSDAYLPSPADVKALGKQRADARATNLLYVGATRAKSALILTYSGEFTELLPKQHSLYAIMEAS